jgi:uncharacterized protein YycO
LDVLLPVTKAVGHLHLPYTRKEVKGFHFYSVLPLIRPGMVFLSKTNGELSNYLIDGEWKHCAMFGALSFTEFSYPYVVEAIGKGVTITDLVSFMTSKDRLVLLEPAFASQAEMAAAAKIADRYLNAPYDYYFTPGNQAFYCSELIADCYESALGKPVFERRERMGVHTIIPNDYYKAKDKWRVVWQSHE